MCGNLSWTSPICRLSSADSRLPRPFKIAPLHDSPSQHHPNPANIASCSEADIHRIDRADSINHIDGSHRAADRIGQEAIVRILSISDREIAFANNSTADARQAHITATAVVGNGADGTGGVDGCLPALSSCSPSSSSSSLRKSLIIITDVALIANHHADATLAVVDARVSLPSGELVGWRHRHIIPLLPSTVPNRQCTPRGLARSSTRTMGSTEAGNRKAFNFSSLRTHTSLLRPSTHLPRLPHMAASPSTRHLRAPRPVISDGHVTFREG